MPERRILMNPAFRSLRNRRSRWVQELPSSTTLMDTLRKNSSQRLLLRVSRLRRSRLLEVIIRRRFYRWHRRASSSLPRTRKWALRSSLEKRILTNLLALMVLIVIRTHRSSWVQTLSWTLLLTISFGSGVIRISRSVDS